MQNESNAMFKLERVLIESDSVNPFFIDIGWVDGDDGCVYRVGLCIVAKRRRKLAHSIIKNG